MRTDRPVALEGIDIGGGNTALQVASDVLEILRRLAVDISRQVEVEFILLDFLEADHAGIFGDFEALVEGVDDLVDVLGTQAILGTILHEATTRVDHEDALAGMGVFLVDHDDAGGNAGAVEQVCGQADQLGDIALADQIAADVGLGVTPEQHAVRQDARAFARALQRADDVQQIGVVALLGRWRAEGLKTLIGIVERIEAGAPALVAERRIGNHIVEGLERVAVPELGIGQCVALHDERRGVVVQDHVHPRETAGGGVLFLPVERHRSSRFVGNLEQQRG